MWQWNLSLILLILIFVRLTQEVVGAEAAQWRRHPVDGDAEQLHGHLRLGALTEVTVIADAIQQDVCHLQKNTHPVSFT